MLVYMRAKSMPIACANREHWRAHLTAQICKNSLKKSAISHIIAAGEYKEIDAYYRDWTQKERAYIQNLIQEEYQTFITDVAKARNLELKDSSKFAEGRVFNAAKAKELGLIDEYHLPKSSHRQTKKTLPK